MSLLHVIIHTKLEYELTMAAQNTSKLAQVLVSSSLLLTLSSLLSCLVLCCLVLSCVVVPCGVISCRVVSSLLLLPLPCFCRCLCLGLSWLVFVLSLSYLQTSPLFHV